MPVPGLAATLPGSFSRWWPIQPIARPLPTIWMAGPLLGPSSQSWESEERIRMQGKHELAVQHGRWGYYGVVRLEVEVVSAFRGVRIQFVAAGEHDWKAGGEFGIAYAY